VEVMADKTDSRLTRDLMLEAVPNSSANILAARETWSLGAAAELGLQAWIDGNSLTNDERNHWCAVSTRRFETFDQLLDLPYFNILFGLVGLGSTHNGGVGDQWPWGCRWTSKAQRRWEKELDLFQCASAIAVDSRWRWSKSICKKMSRYGSAQFSWAGKRSGGGHGVPVWLHWKMPTFKLTASASGVRSHRDCHWHDKWSSQNHVILTCSLAWAWFPSLTHWAQTSAVELSRYVYSSVSFLKLVLLTFHFRACNFLLELIAASRRCHAYH